MTRTLPSCLLLSCLLSVIPTVNGSWWIWRRQESAARSVPDAGYYDPREFGGRMLTDVVNTFPPGQGEPVNIIISGHSESAVLEDREVEGGLRNYFLSLHFSGDCLGQQLGNRQRVDTGDGKGLVNETAVLRYNYGDPALGACRESIEGGNHFRMWTQNGPERNTGAVFLAASEEMPLAQGHDIVRNGYNLGRDLLVGNITNTTIPSLELTNQSTYSGYTWSNGYTYYTDVRYVSGLLENTSIGINHNWSVMTEESNAVDGLVAVFRVAISEYPEDTNAAMELWPPSVFMITLLLGVLALL